MKKLLYLLLLLSACKSNPDKKVAVVKSDTVDKMKPADTTFLQKERTKDIDHIVYIEKNRNSRSYKALLDFKYDHNDSVNYNQTYKILKVKHRKPLKRYNTGILPQQWLPLNLYKGKYYLYMPNDGSSIQQRVLTDSTLIYYDMDGPTVQPLLDLKKINEYKYTLRSLPFYQFVKSANVTIYIIDPKNMVTVWEDKSVPEDYRYRLYVAQEHAHNYDMVVNYCRAQRTDEFKFDKIDFKALINGR